MLRNVLAWCISDRYQLPTTRKRILVSSTRSQRSFAALETRTCKLGLVACNNHSAAAGRVTVVTALVRVLLGQLIPQRSHFWAPYCMSRTSLGRAGAKSATCGHKAGRKCAGNVSTGYPILANTLKIGLRVMVTSQVHGILRGYRIVSNSGDIVGG